MAHWGPNTGSQLPSAARAGEAGAQCSSLLAFFLFYEIYPPTQGKFGTNPFLGLRSLTLPPAAGSDTLFCTTADLAEFFPPN